MAGESPDKSGKKQASGKARGANDPRLAVLRGEPAETDKATEAENAERGASEAAEESGGAAAPKKPEAATDGASEASEADGASGAAKSTDSAETDEAADGGDGPGKDRLRAAVAAWVAGEGDGAESADASDGADPADGDDDSDGADADTGGADDAADGGGAKAAAKAIGAAAGGAKGSVAEEAATSGADAGAESGTRSEAGDAGAERDEAADADADAGGEGADGAESADEANAEGGAAKSKDGGARPKVEEAKAVGRKASDAEDASGKGDAAASKGDDVSVADGGETSDEDDDVDRPTAVFTTKGKKSGADEEPVDDATRAFTIAKPKGKKKPEEKAKPEGKEESEAEPKAATGADGKSKESEKGEARGEGESADKAQPKAANKADAKGSADKDAKAPKGEVKGAAKAKGPEREAERTSQFVALKSDDTGAAGRSIGKTAAKPGEKPGEKDDSATSGAGAAAAASRSASGESGTEKSAAEKSGAEKPAADKSAKPGKPPAGATAGPQPAALPASERTRQEPLPPLDLLAQLTNTPPPPETTLRTVARRFKIWTPLVILLAIVFVVVQSLRTLPEPTPVVGESTAFTFKGGKLSMPWPGQGQSAAEVVGVGSLGTSGPQKPVPTASVAKVMTAYVILRDHPLKKGEKGATLTIDAKAAADSKNKDESRVPLQEGQKFNQTQMLQMLMIPSGNNAARQLARWDAGSEEAFVKKMNAAADKLGMTNTTYTDPSGLAKTTVSTAVDQLKLAREVMKNGAFRAVVATENVQIDGLPERLFNNNSLLTTMPYVVRGIKTGSSTPAGGAFMWAAYRTVGGKDQLLLGVTMDQRTSSSDPNAHLMLALDNSAKVITAAREALVADTVVKKGQVVGYVDDGLGGETPVVATKDLTAVGWPGLKAAFSIGSGGKTVPHTAKAGTEVGVLTVGSGDSTQQVPVALAEDLTEPTFGAKLTRLG
ncbi:D-alanyl-D-alanine carboxypeptidase [Streptomyces benahoarensis]|uniref:D-alanyl-D-alanine carboxypeptidase n=1 Tax=Streptomyces benahoarensis TaxID=2595054 RepID=A0A553Z3S4_9ACTN|nr:D-alanyl-D-alanine carboxypeptidase [Streptomyces benahoarensis]TSB18668.1 D-alanyl-D-alanine carboxypeptidase [Streptomyces benahoarensis]TSB36049.1 D-alanyl-D-alanine carboxypeptidase [Streptomyces benahoarensis]